MIKDVLDIELVHHDLRTRVDKKLFWPQVF